MGYPRFFASSQKLKEVPSNYQDTLFSNISSDESASILHSRLQGDGIVWLLRLNEDLGSLTLESLQQFKGKIIPESIVYKIDRGHWMRASKLPENPYGTQFLYGLAELYRLLKNEGFTPNNCVAPNRVNWRPQLSL